jgi:hypothetical protein
LAGWLSVIKIMIYYSKTTKGFYTTEIHGKNIPSDCIEISKEYHKQLLDSQSNGNIIEPDKNGYPVSVKPEISYTWEQIRNKRDLLLKESDWSMLVDTAPKPSRKAWLSYRQSLRDLPQTFSNTTEIIWPEIPQ